MKKILNRPEDLVEEMGTGIALSNPEVEWDHKFHFIKKRAIDPDKVTLISGGGSGHEPAHAGFVGKGMLDVAVCGDVFASPSQIQIYQAIKASATDKGVLLIIKNYSGDMMNFGNAAALAREDGIDVECIKVDDDIAVQDSLYTVGRRGVAGTVLVHKIAGAAAEAGLSLAEVKALAEEAVANTKTIGFALTSCTVPAAGVPTFGISETEMEYGVGIHGEPGIRRERLVSADELAERTVDALLGDLDFDGAEATLMVNGFGATPLMELYILNNAVRRVLDERSVKLYRSFVGNYMTSIDMQGASITLMRMADALKPFLDALSAAPGFTVAGPAPVLAYAEVAAIPSEVTALSETVKDPASPKVEGERLSLANMVYLVEAMGSCIIENEIPFCEFDAHAGDGDFGMSVAKGFRQLRTEWNGILTDHLASIGDFLDACSLVIMEYCGGASGPIWGSAFRAAARAAGDALELDLNQFSNLMQSAVQGIQATGERSFGRGAVVGDKTLIDALAPCADALSISALEGASFADALASGAAAAVAGADATKEIVARMGRAGTVGERSIGWPDAGAFALGVIFTEMSASLEY